MLQIAYTSVATQSLGSGDVFKIVDKSAKNNASAELTGFLIYSDGHFFQVIEGPIVSVDKLVSTLKTDPRHHSIKIACHSRIIERSFPSWRMRRIIEQEEGKSFDSLMPEMGAAPEKVRRAAEKFLGLALA